MKQALNIHNNILYGFREHERSRVVTITKGEEKEKYMVYKLDGGKLVCSCPGFQYRSYCWHTTYLVNNALEPVHEPWADWAEDAMMERMRRKEPTE